MVEFLLDTAKKVVPGSIPPVTEKYTPNRGFQVVKWWNLCPSQGGQMSMTTWIPALKVAILEKMNPEGRGIF